MNPHGATKQVDVVHHDQRIDGLVDEESVPRLRNIRWVPEYRHTKAQLGNDDGNPCTDRYPGEHVRGSAAVALLFVSALVARVMLCKSTYQPTTASLRSQNRYPVILAASLERQYTQVIRGILRPTVGYTLASSASEIAHAPTRTHMMMGP